jgi:hypothetical protein
LKQLSIYYRFINEKANGLAVFEILPFFGVLQHFSDAAALCGMIVRRRAAATWSALHWAC